MNWIYSRLAALGAVLAAIALAVARYFQVKGQRDDARAERDYFEATITERDEFDEIDAEIGAEFSDLERVSDNENKDGEMPAHIRDRNDY